MRGQLWHHQESPWHQAPGYRQGVCEADSAQHLEEGVWPNTCKLNTVYVPVTLESVVAFLRWPPPAAAPAAPKPPEFQLGAVVRSFFPLSSATMGTD